jgi:hypothetical protein
MSARWEAAGSAVQAYVLEICSSEPVVSSAVQAYVLEICSSEPVVSSPMRGKSEQSGCGLKEDAEDTEGDPTGDRLRVVVCSDRRSERVFKVSNRTKAAVKKSRVEKKWTGS